VVHPQPEARESDGNHGEGPARRSAVFATFCGALCTRSTVELPAGTERIGRTGRCEMACEIALASPTLQRRVPEFRLRAASESHGTFAAVRQVERVAAPPPGFSTANCQNRTTQAVAGGFSASKAYNAGLGHPDGLAMRNWQDLAVRLGQKLINVAWTSPTPPFRILWR
jgi:hypothetical protein